MKKESTMYTQEALAAKKEEIAKIHPDWDAHHIHESAKSKLRNAFKKANGIKPITKDKVEEADEEVEEAEVKVTSEGKPLEEVKGMGSIEAVTENKTYTTDDGDVITIIA